DYYSSDRTLVVEQEDEIGAVNVTNVEEIISNKLLPKIGGRLRPIPLLEFQLAYHETYAKSLELQTELKPSHIQGSLQMTDSVPNTLTESEFFNLTLFLHHNV